jgi:hypothetical protein
MRTNIMSRFLLPRFSLSHRDKNLQNILVEYFPTSPTPAHISGMITNYYQHTTQRFLSILKSDLSLVDTEEAWTLCWNSVLSHPTAVWSRTDPREGVWLIIVCNDSKLRTAACMVQHVEILSALVERRKSTISRHISRISETIKN